MIVRVKVKRFLWLTLVLVLLLLLPSPGISDSSECANGETESFQWRKVNRPNQRGDDHDDEYDDGPQNFSQSGNVAIGNHLYVFGGNYQFGTTFYNDFYSWDTQTNQWKRLKKGPSARAFPGTASWKGHFLLYGGTDTFQFDSNYTALGDFWCYSVEHDQWERLDQGQQQEVNPGPRTGSTLFVDEDANKVYLFGGFVDFSTEPPNDVWEFDLLSKQWTQLIADTRPQGLLPLGRNIASGGPFVLQMSSGSSNHSHAGTTTKLLIYGGEGFNLTTFQFPILDDLWEFDIATRAWTEVILPVSANDETPRRNYSGNTVVRNNNYLYLFGGDVEGAPGRRGICGGFYPENPTDEIWRYDAVAQQWERLAVTGDPFLRVKDQGQASVVNGSIYLVGGYSCVPGVSGNGERAYINDVYRLTIQCAKTENSLPKNPMSVSSEL